MVASKIRVLIVDDAQFMRKTLAQILSSDPNMEVVGFGRTGKEAVAEIKRLKPDVVTLDIDMPEMDGISALKHIMIQCPTPVVVVSALTQQGDVTFEALRLGVVDFLPKPSGSISRDLESQKEEIINRIKIASTVDITKIRRARIGSRRVKHPSRIPIWKGEKILLIGTSLGGPNSIIRLIGKLPLDFPAPIVVTQDISPLILASFAEKFNEVVPLTVRQVQNDTILEAATVYLNGLDKDISFEENFDDKKIISLSTSNGKAIDAMMISGAHQFGAGTIAMLFSGIGQDGVHGLSAVRDGGGVTIMEDRACSFMPDSNHEAARRGIVHHILDDQDMPSFIMRMVTEG